MHELVLVLADFFVSQETPDRDLPAQVTLPGLQHVIRFGKRSKVPRGWRRWLSRWLTSADSGSAATVAAAALTELAASTTPGAVATGEATPAAAWIATPMHLVAGMTSVHVDRRSILHLEASDQAALAADFERVFHDSGFHLRPLEAGDFLLWGPGPAMAESVEPARLMGSSMSQHAAATPVLRRLGAELEMWLHDHPINDNRRRRGELAVTMLWLWGGGALSKPAVGGHIDSDRVFGCDSYLHGLCAMRGAKVAALPQQLAEVFDYPHARRAVVVIEIGPMLQSDPKWTFFDALTAIDRRFIAPAVQALNTGQYDRLFVLANDYELTLHASDRLKFWRSLPPGLSGLQ